jgi:threonine/homoserine/homoserine lactone efflux protein
MEGFNIIGYLIFAFVACVTPGPNNYLLLSYGKLYGIKNTRALMLGIASGFLMLLYISGYGVAGIITANDTFKLIIKIVGSAWFLYLAIMVRNLAARTEQDKVAKLGFKEAFLMQFVNLKAWIMSIGAAGAFMPQTNNIHLNVFIFAIIFVVVGIPCMFIWATAGDLISKALTNQKGNKIVGNILFLLMLVSITFIWL